VVEPVEQHGPPFESQMEISTGIPEIVCYGYAWGGQYFSEMREL
jgi:hypothetical protein